MNNEWLDEAAGDIAYAHQVAKDYVMRGWKNYDVKAEEWEELADKFTAEVWAKYERQTWGR